MDPGQQLHRKTIKLLSNPTKFRSLIGKLLYLTHFRPEYNFSVCILSQLLFKPTKTHIQAITITMRYIKMHYHWNYHSNKILVSL